MIFDLEGEALNIAYVRVSSVDQNEARQVEALEKFKIEKWFSEKISGKNTNRPKFKEMMEFVREGDDVYIHEFSRLARSTKDLLDIIDTLSEKGVHLHSNKENLDTSTPQGRMMVTVIAAINEFERAIILERQREGIKIAKKNGVYRGGHPKEIDKALFDELLAKYQSRQITKTEFANKLGVSRPTLDKLLKINK